MGNHPLTGQVWTALLAVAGGLVLLWLVLVVALALARPANPRVTDVLRLLPDTVVLLRRIAADPATPRVVRVILLVTIVYLILPLDLIPDFIPVLGYADDAIVVALALRSVTHRAGPAALDNHWPGTLEGLAALRRIAGVPNR